MARLGTGGQSSQPYMEKIEIDRRKASDLMNSVLERMRLRQADRHFDETLEYRKKADELERKAQMDMLMQRMGLEREQMAQQGQQFGQRLGEDVRQFDLTKNEQARQFDVRAEQQREAFAEQKRATGVQESFETERLAGQEEQRKFGQKATTTSLMLQRAEQKDRARLEDAKLDQQDRQFYADLRERGRQFDANDERAWQNVEQQWIASDQNWERVEQGWEGLDNEFLLRNKQINNQSEQFKEEIALRRKDVDARVDLIKAQTDSEKQEKNQKSRLFKRQMSLYEQLDPITVEKAKQEVSLLKKETDIKGMTLNSLTRAFDRQDVNEVKAVLVEANRNGRISTDELVNYIVEINKTGTFSSRSLQEVARNEVLEKTKREKREGLSIRQAEAQTKLLESAVKKAEEGDDPNDDLRALIKGFVATDSIDPGDAVDMMNAINNGDYENNALDPLKKSAPKLKEVLGKINEKTAAKKAERQKEKEGEQKRRDLQTQATEIQLEEIKKEKKDKKLLQADREKFVKKGDSIQVATLKALKNKFQRDGDLTREEQINYEASQKAVDSEFALKAEAVSDVVQSDVTTEDKLDELFTKAKDALSSVGGAGNLSPAIRSNFYKNITEIIRNVSKESGTKTANATAEIYLEALKKRFLDAK